MSMKSFDEIRGLVESVVMQKKAHDANTPSDPFEVATPAASPEGVIAEKCVNVPKGAPNGTVAEKQTPSITLMSADDKASVNPEKKEVETITEEAVVKKGSALLSKIQGKLSSKKEANISNVASGIDLSVESLAKVASEILNTEEGVKFAQELFRKRAGEEYAKEAIKEASEQARAFVKYEDTIKKAAESMNEQEQFITKLASQIEALPEAQKKLAYASIQAHDTNLSSYGDAEVLKCAYAAGVEDAAAIQENPEILEDAAQEPTEEEAGVADITPEEVLEVLNEMVEAGEVDEKTAQQLVSEIAALGGEGEEADVTIDDVLEVIDDLLKAGEIDEQTAQQLIETIAALGEGEGVEQEQEQAPTEAAKMASAIIEGTQRLKKASAEEGNIPAEEAEATIEDVVNVIQQLKEEGSISEEEAQAILQEIAAAMAEESEVEEKEPEEAAVIEETPEGEDVAIAEEIAKSASIINSLK